ncbi:MAG: hypothetical protein CSA13_00760 [Clostridiales bacterium]|nr:MAG: hypothetical protein CSA13_00760 [Clostridiales bacterium]
MNDLNTTQTVNDKLVLLYIYSKIAIPVKPMDVADIVLRHNLMEYYTIGHYTSELVNSGMLEVIVSDERENYLITQSGINTLALFQERLDRASLIGVEQSITDLKKKLKRHRIINTQVQKIEKDNYLVNLRIMEGSYPLIDLSLSVVSNAQANQLVSKWQEEAAEIYGMIISSLTSDC